MTSEPDLLNPPILSEVDELGQAHEPRRRLTYSELDRDVRRAAGALASIGVAAGDRVILHMGMTPEAAIAMLACARLGAIHQAVPPGLSAEVLASRIVDCEARVVITQDEVMGGGRRISLKATVDLACEGTGVETVVVSRRPKKRAGVARVPWREERDIWWHDLVG